MPSASSGLSDLLVAEAEGRRHDLHAGVQTGSGELPVKGDVVAADQQGHHHVRPVLLDALDHRAEIDHVERDELPARLVAAGLVQEDFDPVGGDVPVIVIGGQRVERRAVLLDRPRDQHAQLLRRRRPGAEDELVARRLRTARCRSTRPDSD